MDLIHNLGIGFGVAFTVQNLLYAFFGCLLGTLIGVLPGIGPVATIAMLLPSTYALDATPALIMLAGIYYGAQYGGSTTAILINVPGESSSVVTAIDGYQMARQGRAGAALAAAGLGSFFAGCVGTIIIAAFAPPLTELAFNFGPAEYFSLMVLGLIGAVVLASGSLLKAISMIILGLLLAQINTDVISGTARYSFDVPELTDGIGFVVIAMGVFGFGEIISNLGQPAEHREVFGAVVVLGIGDRRFQTLLDDAGGALLRERQDVERVVHLLAANQVGDEPALVGREADTANDRFGFHRHQSLLLHGLLVRRVALERAREREFTELVADHLVRDVDRHVLLAVVHGDRHADEIGQDRRATRPGLDRLLVLRRRRLLDFRREVMVDERALLE
jgi:hypothetical protein